jgi:extracellular factor (EF) 3-hydroxypalmitic acid methyl ester biosynthesis protein
MTESFTTTPRCRRPDPNSGEGERLGPEQFTERRRRRLIKGLRSVARLAVVEGRARRHEVVLCDRVAAVRSELLEIAALLHWAQSCDEGTGTALHWLLTDGCDSPLYNPDVPERHLSDVLDRAREALSGADPSSAGGAGAAASACDAPDFRSTRSRCAEAPHQSQPRPGEHRRTMTHRCAANLTADTTLSPVDAAADFVDLLASIERRAGAEQPTLPTVSEHTETHAAFWNRLIPALRRADLELASTELPGARAAVRAVLDPWMMRSPYWWRARSKPHGFPGDYQMIEALHRLESLTEADPGEPVIVNLLAELTRTVAGVQALWHRRRWFSMLICNSMATRRPEQPLRLLDIAGGGSRHLRDAIARCGGSRIDATLIDHDPAALAHAHTWLTATDTNTAQLICSPANDLLAPLKLPDASADFDIVLCTGLLDYLPQAEARILLTHLASRVAAGGTLAVCAVASDDGSREVKEWISDWKLSYRTAQDVRALFAPDACPATSCSPDGGLMYATVRQSEADRARHATRDA